MKNEKITWTSKTTNIDRQTGEILHKKNLHNYIKIKTIKHATIRNNRGHIEYTTEWEQSKQQQLTFNNT